MLCGIQVYVKFAGAAVACLRRWLSADNIPPDEELEEQFLDNVHRYTEESVLIDDMRCPDR